MEVFDLVFSYLEVGGHTSTFICTSNHCKAKIPKYQNTFDLKEVRLLMIIVLWRVRYFDGIVPPIFSHSISQLMTTFQSCDYNLIESSLKKYASKLQTQECIKHDSK